MDYMSDIDKNKLFELYTLAELAYERQFEETIYNKTRLYPEGWYENKNYKLKIEILTEAIKNSTLIENIPKYKETIEGIKNLLVKNQ